MPDRRGRRSGRQTGSHRYPRTARVNELLREVLATALEEVVDEEDLRLELVTVTAVEVTPDLRQATVYYDAMRDGAQEALEELRVKLQAAIGRESHLKRTPQLSFVVDPGVVTGERIDHVLRELGSG